MRPLLLAVTVLLAAASLSAQSSIWQPSPGHTQLAIWPGTPPDAQPLSAQEVVLIGTAKQEYAVRNVSRPTMTVFAPKADNTGAAVVVFPGGGYQILSIGPEGSDVCDWLTSKGVTCVLLKYRVPDSGPHWDKQCNCQRYPKSPTALEDAQRTIGLVRLHAAEWHIDPHKIGVLGFSAGGHLVAAISTHFDKRLYLPVDAADKQSCRPDFAVVLYPGHLWFSQEKELNPDIRVTAKTPPTFLLQAENDPVDDVENSLVYFAALKRAGVPAEIHVYAQGGHAFGLRHSKLPISEWPQLVDTWFGTIGVLITPPVDDGQNKMALSH
jgi:acetyl esterase/lipase